MVKFKKILKLGLVFCILIFGISSVLAQTVAPKKAVMIIAQKDFQDDEFFRPKEVLEKNGIKVTVASTTLSEVKGMLGGKTKPDILLKKVKVNDYDAVIFIGGSGATQYLNDPTAHRLAKEAISKDKVVGAICIAPVMLTNAGVLKGKRATVYPTEADKLKAGGVNYTGRPVEKDGNIITSDGPKSAREFGDEISRALLTR